jgi:hypothetical protein
MMRAALGQEVKMRSALDQVVMTRSRLGPVVMKWTALMAIWIVPSYVVIRTAQGWMATMWIPLDQAVILQTALGRVMMLRSAPGQVETLWPIPAKQSAPAKI